MAYDDSDRYGRGGSDQSNIGREWAGRREAGSASSSGEEGFVRGPSPYQGAPQRDPRSEQGFQSGSGQHNADRYGAGQYGGSQGEDQFGRGQYGGQRHEGQRGWSEYGSGPYGAEQWGGNQLGGGRGGELYSGGRYGSEQYGTRHSESPTAGYSGGPYGSQGGAGGRYGTQSGSGQFGDQGGSGGQYSGQGYGNPETGGQFGRGAGEFGRSTGSQFGGRGFNPQSSQGSGEHFGGQTQGHSGREGGGWPHSQREQGWRGSASSGGGYGGGAAGGEGPYGAGPQGAHRFEQSQPYGGHSSERYSGTEFDRSQQNIGNQYGAFGAQGQPYNPAAGEYGRSQQLGRGQWENSQDSGAWSGQQDRQGQFGGQQFGRGQWENPQGSGAWSGQQDRQGQFGGQQSFGPRGGQHTDEFTRGAGGFGSSQSHSQSQVWNASTSVSGTPGRQNFAGRGPKGYQRPDDRIEDEVHDRLTRHPGIDASDIEITVKGGEVTISGAVEDRRDKRLVEDIVEEVSGVREVRNQIKVRGRQGTSMALGDREVGRTPEREIGTPSTSESRKSTGRSGAEGSKTPGT